MAQTQKIYGDEKLGYNILVRHLTPNEASENIQKNIDYDLIKEMPHGRLLALIRRAKED